MDSLTGLALEDLHQLIKDRISSKEDKNDVISILNTYSKELEHRGEKTLAQSISNLVGEIFMSKIDNVWVVEKITELIDSQFSKSYFQNQRGIESKVLSKTVGTVVPATSRGKFPTLQKKQEITTTPIDTSNWSMMSDWLVIDNFLEYVANVSDVNIIIESLNELRSHLSSSLSSRKLYDLNHFINQVKSSKQCNIYDLSKFLRTVQSEVQ